MLPNTLLLQGAELDKGAKTGLVFRDGALSLVDDQTIGILESPVMTVPEFTNLVASWNSTTLRGAFVELLVKVKGDIWSQWFSYGRWSDNGRNIGSIKGQKDKVAHMEVDLLRMLAKGGDAIQFRLELTRDSCDIPSPRVRLIAFTWTPTKLTDNKYTGANIALKVAPRAQLPVPKIGNIICSPTSLATVMAYHGRDESTEHVAAGAQDNGAGIYGNWSYNVAYASEKGFTAWVQRCDSMEDVQGYLQQGLPIVASVRIAAKEELTGALSAYPGGHLLVITGLIRQDGRDWVLVNDPAANTEEQVPRQYALDQFMQAWSNRIIYVLKRQAD